MELRKWILKLVPIFSELSDWELEKLVEIVQERKYKAGDVIFCEDDLGVAFFIIKAGAVKVSVSSEEGREIILDLLGPNEFFGEISLFDGMGRTATCVATENTTLFVIDRDHFLRFLEDNPKIAIKMLEVLARRLRSADAKIKALAFSDAYSRVAKAILELAKGEQKRGKITVDIGMSRTEFASLAGISRETLARILKAFEKAGWIMVHGRKITILNEAALRGEM